MPAMETPDATLTPAQAVDRLAALHDAAVAALRAALVRFVRDGMPPSRRARRGSAIPSCG